MIVRICSDDGSEVAGLASPLEGVLLYSSTSNDNAGVINITNEIMLKDYLQFMGGA